MCRHSLRIAVRILPLILLYSATNTVRGGGLTIVTHGLGFSPGVPQWMDAMAQAIADRTADPATMSIWTIRVIGDPPMIGDVITESGPNFFTSDYNGEAIIKLDWSELSDPFTGESSTAVANAFADYLLNTTIAGKSWLDQPIHLVGFSRGGSLIPALASRLAKAGVWVDQMTTLDPHPVDGVNKDCSGFGNFGDFAPQVFENVVFADNYWREDDFSIKFCDAPCDPDGEAVPNAYNFHFPESLFEGDGYCAEHFDVHLWYHGTIDTSNSAFDGEESVPTTFYNPPSPSRVSSGYYWSRLAGGARPTTGVSQPFGGSAARISVTRTGTQWPNIGYVRLLDPDANFVAGETIHLSYRYQDYDSGTTIKWYFDEDQNPYDGTAYQIATQTTSPNFDSVNTAYLTSAIPSSTATGQYWVMAHITDGTHSRYTYLTQSIAVVPDAPCPPNAFAFDEITCEESGQDDNDGLCEPGEHVSLRIQLCNNTGTVLKNATGALSTSDACITITDPSAYWDDIPIGACRWSVGSFSMSLCSADPIVGEFVLDVVYDTMTSSDCEWFAPLERVFRTHVPNVVFTPDWLDCPVNSNQNCNDIAESGEFGDIWGCLRNVGDAVAHDCTVCINHLSTSSLEQCLQYPTINPGAEACKRFPLSGSPIAKDYHGPLTGDVSIQCLETEQEIQHARTLAEVFCRPWQEVSPGETDLGIRDPGEPLEVGINICNSGCEDASVTSATLSHPSDTQVLPCKTFPFTLQSGECCSGIVRIAPDPSFLGSLERTVTFNSNGGLFGVDSDVVRIKALITSQLCPHQVPCANPAEDVDIAGNVIVWAESRYGNRDIFAYDMTSGHEYEIAVGAGDQLDPRVGDGVIAWLDRSVGEYGAIRAYRYSNGDLSGGNYVDVAVDSAWKRMVGADHGKVAFTRICYPYDPSQPNDGLKDLFLYDAATSVETNVTHYPCNGTFPTPSVDSNEYDYGGDVLVWQEIMLTVPHSWHDAFLKRLDTSLWPAQPLPPPCTLYSKTIYSPPSANDGKVAFVTEALTNGREQIWFCNGCSCAAETGDDARRGSENLAINVDTLVYNKSGLDALLYWDTPTNSEFLVTQPRAASLSVRVDGNIIAWTGGDGGLFYAFLRGVDLASLNISPQEQLSLGASIAIDANLHNCPHRGTPGPIEVAAYDGRPQDDGSLIDGEIVPAMNGRQYLEVPLSNGDLALVAGEHRICLVAESSVNNHVTYSSKCVPWLVDGNGRQLGLFAQFQNCLRQCLDVAACADFDYDSDAQVDTGDYGKLFPLLNQP